MLVDKSAWAAIISCARNEGAKHEVGGILLGLRRGKYLHVTAATLPGLRDRSSRIWFLRFDRIHQIAAVRKWLVSGFKVDWIGEWHSHPEVSPKPSLVDIQTWQSQANKRRAPMVYVILGLEGFWVGRMEQGSAGPYELELAEESDTSLLFQVADYA
ncbi:MAG: Mov34/MPN/PAD-1 family protein [Nitratireductor sp.]|uniref:Mov34/MPN/PAD-1 family protein n=1 Tax=Alphaproteobacteria TaxID=28211 RepID=UPI0032653551